jgi:hypothetical protein
MALSIAADRETAKQLLVPSFDGEERTATDAAGAEAASHARAEQRAPSLAEALSMATGAATADTATVVETGEVAE